MIKPALIATLSLALLGACSSDSDSGGSGGSGSLSLGVTDAPVDNAEAVVVAFTAVELLDAEGEVALRFDLDQTQQVDLLEQQGDNQFFLIQDEQIPVGVYEEVRLIVADQANASCSAAQSNPQHPSYITIGTTDFPLIVPSGGQSGLKVRGPLTIAAGGSAAYTVDFDLRKSIACGRCCGWSTTPRWAPCAEASIRHFWPIQAASPIPSPVAGLPFMSTRAPG